jgi:ribosomal protein S18 acetylase RimI-like enzyme
VRPSANADSLRSFVERKFVHENGLVGHIEDIVVHKDYRKLQFGRFIIDQLTTIGKVTGCYKIILDCSDKNVPFVRSLLLLRLLIKV